MLKTRSWSLVAVGLVAALLSACGGGAEFGGGTTGGTLGGTTGGTTGGDPTPTPTPTPGTTVSTVVLLASSPTLSSFASDVASGVTLTAIVKDGNNNVVPGSTVVFATDDSAEINVVNPALTDENGRVTAVVTTGGDPANRSITIAASASGVSANVSIQVVGTVLEIDGPLSVQTGTPSSYTVTLLDSSDRGIPGRAVTLNATNGSVAPASVTTDAQGKAEFQFTPISGTAATLTASALGATRTLALTVADDTFVIEALPEELALGSQQAVTVTWLRVGSPVSGRPITLTTTRGDFVQAMPLLSNAQGRVTATLRTNKNGGGLSTAGVATILAVGNDTSTNPDSTPFATSDIEFVATVAATVDVQGDPTVIGTNQESTIVATVRDANNNPVKNATVLFSVEDVSGGKLSAPSGLTNSQGRTSVIYRSSSATSGQDGVRVSAAVSGAPASVNDTALLTVGSQALRIALGTGNEIVETEDTTRYELPYSAIVTDSGGNPALNAELSVTGFPEVYAKGYYPGEPGAWVPRITALCDNEDRNENGIMDPGEDINGNGILDPANVAAVPLRPEIDENGIASFVISYPQDRGNWIDVFRLRARARVAGTEATEVARFGLPISASDATGEGSPPGAVSPFGRVGRCDLTDEQVPLVDFDSSSLTAVAFEGGANAVLTLVANKGFAEDVVIPVFVAPLTPDAFFGDISLAATVTLPANTTTTSITVVAVDDSDIEIDEQFAIFLGDPITRNAVIGPRSTSTVTISDNDEPPSTPGG
jgi:hypothetical protein